MAPSAGPPRSLGPISFLCVSLHVSLSIDICFIPVSVSVWVCLFHSLSVFLSALFPHFPSAPLFPLRPSSFITFPLLSYALIFLLLSIPSSESPIRRFCNSTSISISLSLSLCLCGIWRPFSSHHITLLPLCLPVMALLACSPYPAEAEFCACLREIKVLQQLILEPSA